LHRFFGEFENGVRSNALHNSCIKTLGRVQKKIRDELEKARSQLNTAINEKEINQKRELIHKYKWMEKYFNDTLKKVLFNSSKDEYTWLKTITRINNKEERFIVML
ncbi:MAG: hypothetical protein FWC77_00680, partial [Defluviitaleaceae bacterium]|nr:hypothetical protein [Defluviitaleaceae bacterium]